MKYRIKYTYDTGDTFSNQYGLEGFLELDWENLEVAKDNLKRIKEHYSLYELLEGYNNRYKDHQKILEENRNKDWFVASDRLVVFKEDSPDSFWAIDEKDKAKVEKEGMKTKYIIDETTAQHQIRFKTDAGKEWQIWAPWCGYFERLVGAEIVGEDNEMKFEI